jgi:four helix bundle protein
LMIFGLMIFGLLIVDLEKKGMGMDSKELKNRTKEFAHRCVKLALALPKTPLGKHIGGQLIRCSTSVAANYRATLLSQTKASFVSKISIVVEEADESEFWLEFIIDEKLMKREKVLPLLSEAHELASIFITTRKTAQRNSKQTY